ncbi:MAG: hypothetical protein LDLANPLL_00845 [Turneriella sp.]|nr:hypothetical protein [Turneriella sp.]
MVSILKRNWKILTSAFQHTDAPTRRRFVVLFFLTAFTMFLSGATFSRQITSSGRYADAGVFTLALMTILSSHAFTRFIQARSYGVFAALPFFIPMPLFSPFGTLGVVTKTANVGLSVKALFDIAFWGPVMSFLLSVTFLFIGVWVSDVAPGRGAFDNPLILTGIIHLLKDIPSGYDIAMHPLIAAGWAGLLFTAINLFPLGSLSGGQIAYALFGPRQRTVGYLFMTALFVMALYYPLWFAFVLIFIYLGVEHPSIRQNLNPLFADINPNFGMGALDRRRQLLSLVSATIFALSFTVTPFAPEILAPGQIPTHPYNSPPDFAPYQAPQTPEPPPPMGENSI